jgi:hypothetical protein
MDAWSDVLVVGGAVLRGGGAGVLVCGVHGSLSM